MLCVNNFHAASLSRQAHQPSRINPLYIVIIIAAALAACLIIGHIFWRNMIEEKLYVVAFRFAQDLIQTENYPSI